jgi:hypothetical protein
VDWWDEEPPERSDEYTRRACFVHLSQRAYWSKPALLCALATHRYASGEGALVELVAEHVADDLVAAVTMQQ